MYARDLSASAFSRSSACRRSSHRRVKPTFNLGPQAPQFVCCNELGCDLCRRCSYDSVRHTTRLREVRHRPATEAPEAMDDRDLGVNLKSSSCLCGVNPRNCSLHPKHQASCVCEMAREAWTRDTYRLTAGGGCQQRWDSKETRVGVFMDTGRVHSHAPLIQKKSAHSTKAGRHVPHRRNHCMYACQHHYTAIPTDPLPTHQHHQSCP